MLFSIIIVMSATLFIIVNYEILSFDLILCVFTSHRTCHCKLSLLSFLGKLQVRPVTIPDVCHIMILALE